MLSATRDVVVFGSVQRCVPPTDVTSGSEVGQITDGYGMTAGFFTGCFMVLVEPPSPEEASTVTPFCDAQMNAWRRFNSDCALPNAPSPGPKLCELTLARGWPPTYC